MGCCRCYFALLSFAPSGAVTVFTIKWAKRLNHHEPFLTKYPLLPPINCSKVLLFFLAARLYADSSLAYYHLVGWMWDVNIKTSKTGHWAHMADGVPCSLPWEGDPSSGRCNCMCFPMWTDTWLSIYAFQLEMVTLQMVAGLNMMVLISTECCCMHQWTKLSCQWASVSLKPIFFNMRDCSCSYFLAFLLL